MTRPIASRSLLNSLGVVLYVTGVASIMANGNTWFGQKDTFLTGVVVLLLFCISAAVVGGLVFGYPLALFLKGQKREAVQAAAITVGCLIVETVLLLIVMAVSKSL